MKELISEEEALWFIQQETGVKYTDINDARFEEQVITHHIDKWNKRHEEVMREREWKAWQSSTFSYDLSYDGSGKAEDAFERYYNKKYGSDE